MSAVTYLLGQAVIAFIGIMQLLMMVRAILSWLPTDDDNAFTAFVFNVTEIVIYPVRCILERSETIASMPIDLSFFVTFLLLSVLETLLTF